MYAILTFIHIYLPRTYHVTGSHNPRQRSYESHAHTTTQEAKHSERLLGHVTYLCEVVQHDNSFCRHLQVGAVCQPLGLDQASGIQVGGEPRLYRLSVRVIASGWEHSLWWTAAEQGTHVQKLVCGHVVCSICHAALHCHPLASTRQQKRDSLKLPQGTLLKPQALQ